MTLLKPAYWVRIRSDGQKTFWETNVDGMCTPLYTMIGETPPAPEESRFHLTEPSVTINGKVFGKGWLLISEEEYAIISAAKGVTEAAKIVNSWYSWIVSASDDMDMPEGVTEEDYIRRLNGQRHTILASLSLPAPGEGEAKPDESSDTDHGNVSAWCRAIGVKVFIRGTDANPVVEIRSGRFPMGGIVVKRRMEQYCRENSCEPWRDEK